MGGGFRPGDFSIFAGMTGSGKTAFLRTVRAANFPEEKEELVGKGFADVLVLSNSFSEMHVDAELSLFLDMNRPATPSDVQSKLMDFSREMQHKAVETNTAILCTLNTTRKPKCNVSEEVKLDPQIEEYGLFRSANYVFRCDNYGTVSIIKNRHGGTGTIKVKFVPHTKNDYCIMEEINQ